MNRKQKNWLQRPNVTWNWVAVAMVLWTIGLLMLDRRTRIIDDLETRVSRPLDFRIRDQLGHSPELHPSIKVFGIDDSTVAWMGSASPDIMQWATLLESFARARPAAIIIDTPNVNPYDAEEIQNLQRFKSFLTTRTLGQFGLSDSSDF